jgi:hypothetical protein
MNASKALTTLITGSDRSAFGGSLESGGQFCAGASVAV